MAVSMVSARDVLRANAGGMRMRSPFFRVREHLRRGYSWLRTYGMMRNQQNNNMTTIASRFGGLGALKVSDDTSSQAADRWYLRVRKLMPPEWIEERAAPLRVLLAPSGCGVLHARGGSRGRREAWRNDGG